MKKKKHKSYTALLYVLPAMIVILAVIVYPVIKLIIGSFMTTVGGKETFAWFHNFTLIFKDPLFTTAIKNNLKLFLCVPFMTVFALIIAVILFNKIKGWKFYRSIIFVPFILAIPVVGIVFTYILQLNGVLNTSMRSLGMNFLALDWLGNPKIAIWSVGTVIIWKQFGFGVVLFLARLMSVDAALFEAAEVDGANWIQKFINITIPMTASIIEFYVMICLIDMLSWVFSFVFVMTAGGPGSSTTVLEFLIYKKSFGGGNYNLALAISVVVLVIAAILIVIQQAISNRGKDNE